MVFFHVSSNRTASFKRMQAVFNEPQVTLKVPHTIRWLGMKSAVDAVYKSYKDILATLQEADEGDDLYDFFLSCKRILLLHFLEMYILSLVS